MKKMSKKEILQWIGRLLSIASIAFVVYAIWKMGLDFSFVTSVPLFILIMIGAVLVKILSLWMSGTAWSQWLVFFSGNKSLVPEARMVFWKANIGKYIPGNVMHFVQRNLFAANMGVTQVQLAASSVFEVMSYVTVSLLVALLTGREGMQAVLVRYFGDKLPILGIVIACAIVAVIAALYLFRKKIKAALAGHTLREVVITVLKVMGLHLVTLTLLGLILVFLTHYAMGGISLSTAGTVLSAYIIAWVLGYVVPGASGGMGIRETALLMLLGPVMGDSLLLSLAVIHRLVTVIGDFLGYLIAVLYGRKKGKE